MGRGCSLGAEEPGNWVWPGRWIFAQGGEGSTERGAAPALPPGEDGGQEGGGVGRAVPYPAGIS